MRVDSDDLVRVDEWERVRRFSTGSFDDLGALVISGEPGAGKSTLWRAGVAAAEQAGHRVLRSEPTAAETGLAFAGLSDLIAAAVPSTSGTVPEPQRDALEVALLLRPAGREPAAAHAVRLAVLSVLQALGAGGPVLLAVDDVQWLDGASLDALAYAQRRAAPGTLGLLLAARSERTDPLADDVPASLRWLDLVRARSTETVELAPLSPDQVRRVLPFEANAAEAYQVARQSNGNPFWAREIGARLAAGDTSVPALARSLADRLARSLSPAGDEALAVVAASGRLGLAQALRLLDHVEDPAAAIDETVLAGLVSEMGDRLAAAHPLIGAAAVEALPPGRRRRLYERLTDAATSLEPRARFAALAAGAEPDKEVEPDEEVATLLGAAAEAAHGRAGNAEAAAFAVQALQLTATDDRAGRTRRRIRTAELLYLAGDAQAALEHAEDVDLRELSTADLERILRLLVPLVDVVRGTAASASLVSRLSKDDALVARDPRRRLVMLVLASEPAFGLTGRRATAAQAVREAEAIGPEAEALLHQALLNLAVADVIAGDGLRGDLLERADDLETRLPADLLQESADLQRGMWARRVEDLATSRTALQRAIDYARRTGHDVILVTLLTHLAMTEELAGDYAAAHQALQAADDVASWHDWPPQAWLAEARCDLLVADGELDAALTLADAAMPDVPETPLPLRLFGDLVRGRVAGWRGDLAGARGWLERAAARADERGFVDPGSRRGVDASLAEAYVAQGRVDEARQIADRLLELGKRLDRPTWTGIAHRVLAAAEAVAGDLDAAAALAARAVAAHETTPLRPELVRSLLTLGQIERRRRARHRAREVLTRAERLARDLGHRPLLRLVEDELARVAGGRAEGELTATEQRVAELVVGGASNRDAAAALFVSVRTVETHVASIFRKLGVRNRGELRRRVQRG